MEPNSCILRQFHRNKLHHICKIQGNWINKGENNIQCLWAQSHGREIEFTDIMQNMGEMMGKIPCIIGGHFNMITSLSEQNERHKEFGGG